MSTTARHAPFSAAHWQQEQILRTTFSSTAVREALINAYTQPHRRYHTLSHISKLIDLYYVLAGSFKNGPAVMLAIWFHDFVYATDASYPENEVRSVDAMRELLANDSWYGSPEGQEIVDSAAELILCTKDHVPDGNNMDSPLFLDMDMSILAAEPAVLDEYDRNIRSEFAAMDDITFAEGRSSALSAFQARPKVFHSPRFTHLESRARDNIELLYRKWSAVARGGPIEPVEDTLLARSVRRAERAEAERDWLAAQLARSCSSPSQEAAGHGRAEYWLKRAADEADS